MSDNSSGQVADASSEVQHPNAAGNIQEVEASSHIQDGDGPSHVQDADESHSQSFGQKDTEDFDADAWIKVQCK